jgi:DNA-binding HxlR family transcriptional regulator
LVAKCNRFLYDGGMPYRPFTEQNCSIAGALAVVGERWSLLVMRDVLMGRRRFAEIKRNLGVAPNILSDRLAQLVEHGLLERRPISAGVDSHEYVPTPKGRDVSPILTALLQWGDAYSAPDGPPRVQVHAPCGHDAHPQLHCRHCGEVIARGELQSRPGPGATPKQIADGILPRLESAQSA